jgi:hypothetical protein
LIVLSRTGPSDTTVVDFDDGSAFEIGMALDDYRYASHSDLEDQKEDKAGRTPLSDVTAATAALEGK